MSDDDLSTYLSEDDMSALVKMAERIRNKPAHNHQQKGFSLYCPACMAGASLPGGEISRANDRTS